MYSRVDEIQISGSRKCWPWEYIVYENHHSTCSTQISVRLLPFASRAFDRGALPDTFDTSDPSDNAITTAAAKVLQT